MHRSADAGFARIARWHEHAVVPFVSLDRRAPRELAFLDWIRPGERFSHVSAARIWGMPLPSRTDDRVYVVSPPSSDRIRRRGVEHHRRGGDVATVGGIPVSSPIDAFIELGMLLEHEDLVAVGDWMVLNPRFRRPGDPRPCVTTDSLRSVLESRRSWGVREARRAALRVREGVESRQETRLRLLLEDAGHEPPVCGMLVHDRYGAEIGYFDMVWPEARVIVEYDGDQHRTDTAQYEKDILRFDRATAAGWRVVRVRKAGLSTVGRALTLARVREAFDLAA